MCFKKHSILLYFLLVLLTSNYGWAQTPPTLKSTGTQIYCPLSELPIVTSFDIENPDNIEIKAVYIQISTGYVKGEDLLNLSGTHLNITAQPFNILEGKLELRWTSVGNAVIAELIAAVKNVMFKSSSSTPSGSRTFSITIGDANYLPSTGHYYKYVPNLGITWTSAKAAAEASPKYYGLLKGYLATITSPEEAQLSGKQAAGAGWIGGSDAEIEGTWKWVTGPEDGKIFYKNGTTNGTDIPFAFWNTLEPNNQNNEDYAHVTAPGVGNSGSWNDLSNTGEPAGDYQPKGYIVEYGGMPSDPVLNLSTSTTISVAAIATTVNNSRCGAGTVNLSATATSGAKVLWFDSLTSSIILESDPNYAPVLTATKTFYVLASANGCLEGVRKPVIATIYEFPTIISAPNVTVCEGNSGTLNAIASSTTATINWYSSPIGGIPFETVNSFDTTATIQKTTYYVDATENGCTTPNRTEVQLEVLGNKVSEISPISLNDITIVDDSSNNSISIQNFSDFNNYEFNVDNFDEFGNQTTFEHLLPGIYFLYLRNKSTCDITKLDIPILGFPKFFTPNDDGQNDTWKVLGNDNNNIKIKAIYVFDRFGKLVADVDLTGDGWNGFYNGERLPGSDYWYLVKYTDQYGDSREKRGNLSLIRR